MAHWKPFLQKIVLWLLFFFICLGLGYPTVSRYEPGAVDGLYDARAYAAIVTGSPVLKDSRICRTASSSLIWRSRYRRYPKITLVHGTRLTSRYS
jgi:hypothetical protein